MSDLRRGGKIIGQVLFLTNYGVLGEPQGKGNWRADGAGRGTWRGAAAGVAAGHVRGWVGIVLGLGGALLLGRPLTRMLYGVSSADPISLAGASATLIVMALLACYLPARAASRMDPWRRFGRAEGRVVCIV